jgi:hypothetical protein
MSSSFVDLLIIFVPLVLHLIFYSATYGHKINYIIIIIIIVLTTL